MVRMKKGQLSLRRAWQGMFVRLEVFESSMYIVRGYLIICHLTHILQRAFLNVMLHIDHRRVLRAHRKLPRSDIPNLQIRSMILLLSPLPKADSSTNRITSKISGLLMTIDIGQNYCMFLSGWCRLQPIAYHNSIRLIIKLIWLPIFI